ncbi:MAG: aspartate aminotransferase family protein [Methylophaga sp.]|nr:MAG: aspartate aminotransferase family protein [Methylophaga sp.]
MNSINQLGVELTEKLAQLLAAKSQSVSLPIIKDQPIASDDLHAFCYALLDEGQLHNAETWAAHMTPSISSDSLLGQVIASLHNGNLLSPQFYPLLSQIEHQLIDWFCSIFQQQQGHFTAGSTYANLEALWHAREHNSHDTDVIYGSAATHYSVIKACQILGLKFQEIATDNHDRIDPVALEQACSQQVPIAIVLTIGTSACGEIDPLEQCVAISNHYHSWCHIDAAWGGALALLPEFQDLFSYVAKADSVSFDPHKALQQPKPCGILLYQRPLEPMLLADANYLTNHPLQTLPGSYGGELFLSLWLNIISNGIDDIRSNIRLRLQQADLFAAQLKEKTTWEIHISRTGIVCFQPPENVDLEELVVKGLFSRAKIADKMVYRTVFSSDKTQAKALTTALSCYF